MKYLAMGLLAAAACGGGSGTHDGAGDGGLGSSDGGSGGSAGDCPAITKPTTGGTTHEQGFDDPAVQVWKAADSPHLVTLYDLEDIQLTIEPCAYVLLSEGIDISRSGSLTAVGTADKPIVFDAMDPSSPWDQIETLYVTENGQTDDTQGGYLKLAYATLTGGGVTSDGSTDPMIAAHGDDVNGANLPPTEHLDLEHVTVRDGTAYGVLLDSGATFAASSTDLTITGQRGDPSSFDAPGAPLQIGYRNLGAIPNGTYTGNAKDEIVVDWDVDALTRDVEVRALGVPYLMGTDDGDDRFPIGTDSAPATLTIDPGVMLEFLPRDTLEVGKMGTLVARGTSTQPIVFTSAASAPAPGDWNGIQFGDVPTAATAIDHAQISYAGQTDVSAGESCDVTGTGPMNGYGAVGLPVRPLTEMVTNTVIAHSLHDGIERGWTGAPLDFEATNTFTDVTGCKQSYPVPSSGDCPNPVPCD